MDPDFGHFGRTIKADSLNLDPDSFLFTHMGSGTDEGQKKIVNYKGISGQDPTP